MNFLNLVTLDRIHVVINCEALDSIESHELEQGPSKITLRSGVVHEVKASPRSILQTLNELELKK